MDSVVVGSCVLGGAVLAVAGAIVHLGRDRRISTERMDSHIEPTGFSLGRTKEEGLNGAITKRDFNEMKREMAEIRELLK
jgi:hypothetical protein